MANDCASTLAVARNDNHTVVPAATASLRSFRVIISPFSPMLLTYQRQTKALAALLVYRTPRCFHSETWHTPQAEFSF